MRVQCDNEADEDPESRSSHSASDAQSDPASYSDVIEQREREMDDFSLQMSNEETKTAQENPIYMYDLRYQEFTQKRRQLFNQEEIRKKLKTQRGKQQKSLASAAQRQRADLEEDTFNQSSPINESTDQFPDSRDHPITHNQRREHLSSLESQKKRITVYTLISLAIVVFYLIFFFAFARSRETDQESTEWEDPAQPTYCAKYYYQSKCVSSCPQSTFILNFTCVEQCPRSYYIYNQNFCTQFCYQLISEDKFCVSNCTASEKFRLGQYCHRACPRPYFAHKG